MARITAIDLSLTATGIARWPVQGELLRTLSPHHADMERVHWLFLNLMRHCEGADLVVIEGLSFGSNMPSAQERAGLHLMIRHWLWSKSIPTQLVAPSQLKKFATGKGSAEKSMILREIWKRWNVDARNDNEADAYVLLRIGMVLTGEAEAETEPQREVMRVLQGKPPKKKAVQEPVAAREEW